MSYLPQLTEDEIRYICSIIPRHYTIGYFTKNAKQFNKICPGFRASSISEAMATRLLIAKIGQPFISDFIEKHIDRWLSEIKNHYNGKVDEGDSHIMALLHTLPYSVFAENIKLYFKLIGEELLEENIKILSEAIRSLKEADGEQAKLREEVKVKDSEISGFQLELNAIKSELDKSKSELKGSAFEIEALKRNVADFEKIQTEAQNYKLEIKSLENGIRSHEETEKELRIELSELKSNSRQLEEQIRAELEKQQAAEASVHQSVKIPKQPSNMDEFKEFLDYNLTSIGVPAQDKYYPLLKEHLVKVLFQGVPIIVSRATGINIMKCVANTLIGQSEVNILVFDKSISVEEVGRFLSSCGRIVCLDNFVGNFNETELLPLLEGHRDKIIFLTVAYDRTMHYIAKEFLRYCHYLNVNRIRALSVNTDLNEEPSTIMEADYTPPQASTENRYSTILRQVLRELDFPQSLIEQKCAAVFGEEDLCRLLAFEVLPYCADVLQIAPYYTSERLLKYTGDAGKCPYKELFKEWFAL